MRSRGAAAGGVKMGEKSKIAWTDHTFNPWWGCQKISPGCQNCYAETMANRFDRVGDGLWGPNSWRKTFGEDHWREPLKWNRRAKREGKIRRVLSGSMCDVFEDRLGLDREREKLWKLIEETPDLIWMLLTKRPENIDRMLPVWWLNPAYKDQKPDNIWMGITAENQDELEERWPVLMITGMSWGINKLFISSEPLLGPLYLEDKLEDMWEGEDFIVRKIDWVIVGGETGNNARPMNPSWVRSIQKQCKEAGVPFFFKGWGEWGPMDAVREEVWPERHEIVLPPAFKFEDGMEVFKWGRENLVNRLDGKTWEDYPVE